LIIGGFGPRRTPRVAARFASEYNMFSPTAEEFEERVANAHAACREAGRDPKSLRLSVVQTLACGRDEDAARSAGIDVFHYKMIAVVISAAMTSFAGVIYAFYYNNLFPEQVFHISRSIEIILGPIVGGIGTLFGPILGAVVLTGVAETLTATLNALGIDLPGAKQVFYGICLLLVITSLPDGVWPWVCKRIGLGSRKK
jgi:branched-chain amino acid transport system permease protein